MFCLVACFGYQLFGCCYAVIMLLWVVVRVVQCCQRGFVGCSYSVAMQLLRCCGWLLGHHYQMWRVLTIYDSHVWSKIILLFQRPCIKVHIQEEQNDSSLKLYKCCGLLIGCCCAVARILRTVVRAFLFTRMNNLIVMWLLNRYYIVVVGCYGAVVSC